MQPDAAKEIRNAATPPLLSYDPAAHAAGLGVRPLTRFDASPARQVRQGCQGRGTPHKVPELDPEDLTTLLTKCPDVDIDQGEAMLRNNPNISLQDIAEYVKAHLDVHAVRLVQLAAEDSSLKLSMAAKLASILNDFGMDQSCSVMEEAREFVLNAGEK